MTDNPTKTKALELAIQGGGTHAEVVTRASAYHAFLTGTTAAPAGAAAKPAATGKAPAAEKPAAGGKAPAAAAPDKAPAAEKPAAGAGKTNGAAAPKKAATPPSAQSIAADTKAPGGKSTYADVVAMLHKVQNGPAGRPECFKILLEDGGGAKSVRDLKPAHYDAVVEACANVISDEGEAAGDDGDALGDLGAVAGGPERDEMGL